VVIRYFSSGRYTEWCTDDCYRRCREKVSWELRVPIFPDAILWKMIKEYTCTILKSSSSEDRRPASPGCSENAPLTCHVQGGHEGAGVNALHRQAIFYLQSGDGLSSGNQELHLRCSAKPAKRKKPSQTSVVSRASTLFPFALLLILYDTNYCIFQCSHQSSFRLLFCFLYCTW
jgi:hypothetical protein